MLFKKTPSFSVRGEKFNVIILAAGFGSSLRPETDYIPKALIQLGDTRAIDLVIQKYQYISNRIIIAVGYGADILENYVMGRYSRLNPMFSREETSELAGPGKSFVLALDHASSRLPTLVTFCDQIVEEYIPVDNDALGVSQKPDPQFVVDSHPKGLAVVEGEVIVNLIPNKNLDKETYGGFTGLSVYHNTRLLKAISYTKAHEKNEMLDYTFDIAKEYISKVKTLALPISKMYEFGVPEMLEKVRVLISGTNASH